MNRESHLALSMLCRIYRVRGRVQGVGFRNFVQRCAQQIGVDGYARNLDNGEVEVVAQGSAPALEQLEAQLWRGPTWAEVADVSTEETNTRTLRGFGIRA
jgi:acylphosphatase